MTDSPVWEVFYTPHTDDETIGMGGAIARARASGRMVLVVLVTDNQPSVRGLRKFPNHNVSMERRIEWTQALAVLDVNNVLTWELSEMDMVRHPIAMTEHIVRLMSKVHAEYPVEHHHTVWGADDVHVEASLPTLAHVLCAEAATIFQQQQSSALVSLHSVYLYSAPLAARRAPVVVQLSPHERTLKRAALECFKPHSGGIGYGYTSVPELIDSASTDPREFIQELSYVAARPV